MNRSDSLIAASVVVNSTANFTLTGSGAFNGNFTLASGAKLSPGEPLGTLTFSNNLTLSPGSTTILEISALPDTGTLTVISTAPPRIDAITPLGSSGFRLTFSGPTGQDYEIRATTDAALQPVTRWNLLDGGTFGNTPVSFDDLEATNYPQRFYLIRLP